MATLVSVLALGTGCRDAAPVAATPDARPRIISLSPAITRTLEAVGLAPWLVGRSTWCRLETRDISELPAVGDLHERNLEAIVRLRPTHVFFQAADVGSDPVLIALAQEHHWTLAAWPLRTLSEVGQTLDDLPELLTTLDEPARVHLESTCQTLTVSINDAIRPVAAGAGPRVLLVSDDVPPLAWGANTYLGELLQATGATNALPEAAWKSMSLEDLVRIDPEVLIIIAERDGPTSKVIAALPIQAVVEGRVYRLVHEGINIPGPHLVEVKQALADFVRAAHPLRESF
jgi:ABC-type Fe3+-hydroxamate transport system substrate-binding protein